MTSPFNTEAPTPSGAPPLTLVNGRAFVVAAPDGTLHGPVHGAVFEDLRFLSHLTFEVRGNAGRIVREPLGLSTTTPFQSAAVSRPDPTLFESAPAEFYVHRQWLGRGVRHDFEIHNTGHATLERTLTVEVATDFAHLFDMKAGRAGPTLASLEWAGDSGVLVDADDRDRAVAIRTSVTAEVAPGTCTLRWELVCEPGSTVTIRTSFEPVWDREPAGLAFPIDAAPADSQPAVRLADWRRVAPTVRTDDPRLAAAVTSSLADLASLRIFDPVHTDQVIVAAGAPWFMTLFGRDSLLTSWMVMPFLPDLALGTIDALAGLQGAGTNPETEEQPGKIIHELRRHGGDAAFADRGRYYGTVDATPLFVMVVAEANRWGHLDVDGLARRWPHVRNAIDLIRTEIAGDRSGLLRYRRSTDVGLVNQGWKDSWDGVNFADGRLPTGGIALAEVQGYAYAALQGAAELAALVDDELDASALRSEAHHLAERFEQMFWDEASSSYSMGVDGDGQRIDSVTTNPGHAIWCGIADPARAERYYDRIMDDLYNRWGLRTLSPESVRYDPLSYHNGSVWPHDTAIVTAGAAAIGRYDVVDTLVDAALDASWHFGGRPPELFAGVDRSTIDVPVAYPNSCSPQAWASASTMLLLRAATGLDPGSDPAAAPVLSRVPSLDVSAITGIHKGVVRYGADAGLDGWTVAAV